MEQNGQFVTPWREQPVIWLLTYMDTKAPSYDYKAITKGRIAKLPEEVRRAIGV